MLLCTSAFQFLPLRGNQGAMFFSLAWKTRRSTSIFSFFFNAFILATTAIAEDSRLLYKDVVILGGGAGGTHAAIRLREDYGKSVLLIEKESILVRSLAKHFRRCGLLTVLRREATSTLIPTPRLERLSTTAYNPTSTIKAPELSSSVSTFLCKPMFSMMLRPTMSTREPANCCTMMWGLSSRTPPLSRSRSTWT